MTIYELRKDGVVIEVTTDYRRANAYKASCEVNPRLTMTVRDE